MEQLVEKLGSLGLSRNEAKVYLTLLRVSPLTGYEVAKRCALSRGSIYGTLQRLVDKGAVQPTLDEKYVAVDLEQFLEKRLTFTRDAASFVKENVASAALERPRYLVLAVSGHSNIMRLAKTMVEDARAEIYLAGFRDELEELYPYLLPAKERGVALYVMSYGYVSLENLEVCVHYAEGQIREFVRGRYLAMVRDQEESIVGAVDDTEQCTASWSRNPQFCLNVFSYISHDMMSIEVFKLLDQATIARIEAALGPRWGAAGLAGMPGIGDRPPSESKQTT